MHLAIEIHGTTLCLTPEKALFWPAEQLLIVSDIHLGKAAHFRKHGIAVPSEVHNKDLQLLDMLIHRYGPSQIVFLGDLFHSNYNRGWLPFANWLASSPCKIFTLVRGNHDILPDVIYQSTALDITNVLYKGPFSFTHDKLLEKNYYNISGHVHPCVRLNGFARQGLTLPCFLFRERHALLPAFGAFTGSHPIRVGTNDGVYVITEQKVIRLQQEIVKPGRFS